MQHVLKTFIDMYFMIFPDVFFHHEIEKKCKLIKWRQKQAHTELSRKTAPA